MINTNIQAVMIDLDGTMVDTMGDFEAALNLCLADIDLPKVSPAVVNIAVGKGSEHLIRTVLRHQLDLPEVKASGMVCDNTGVENLYEPAFTRYQHHYEKVNGKFADVYPGVLAGLQQLQARGLKMACLTNKPTAFAKALLADKGLAGFFSHVYGGDAFPRQKPDPHQHKGNSKFESLRRTDDSLRDRSNLCAIHEEIAVTLDIIIEYRGSTGAKRGSK